MPSATLETFRPSTDTRAAAVELLGALVREPSVQENAGAIARCLEIVENELRRLGGRLEIHEHDGLKSLIARFGPHTTEPLVFVGHVDVVEPGGGWHHDPFAFVQDGENLLGRGVVDMKGGIAAFCAALGQLARAGVLAACPVKVLITADEEVGSERGMRSLVARGLAAGAAAVCGEPTGLDVYLGNRGTMAVRVVLRGRGGHAGFVHELANPLSKATELVGALEALELTARDDHFDPSYPTLAVTRITADTHTMGVVPGCVEVTFDRRLLPGEDEATVLEPIRKVVAQLVDSPFSATVHVDRYWPPYRVDEKAQIVERARQALWDVGLPARLAADMAADDSSFIGNSGVPTILLGPGEPMQAHAPDELLLVSELCAAVEVYARLIESYRRLS